MTHSFCAYLLPLTSVRFSRPLNIFQYLTRFASVSRKQIMGASRTSSRSVDSHGQSALEHGQQVIQKIRKWDVLFIDHIPSFLEIYAGILEFEIRCFRSYAVESLPATKELQYNLVCLLFVSLTLKISALVLGVADQYDDLLAQTIARSQIINEPVTQSLVTLIYFLSNFIVSLFLKKWLLLALWSKFFCTVSEFPISHMHGDRFAYSYNMVLTLLPH